MVSQQSSHKPSADRTHDPAVTALMRQVGDRVRDTRRDRGLSRRALSEASGVSPRYLAQLEAGEGNISIGLLKKISLALEVGVESFVLDNPSQTDDFARVSALFKAADAATKARVLNILDPDRLRTQKARRICLVGLRGAGKSTLGSMAAETLGMHFVELNDEIEKDVGMPTAEIIALYGPEGYRDLESTALDRISSAQDSVILAVAGGIVGNLATYDTLLSRFHTIWLQASPTDHMERVRGQGDLRPMKGNPQAMIQLRQILKTREAQYARADHIVDTSGQEVAVSCQQLCDLLCQHQIAERP
ncbi:MAG: helix-turn-helix transcriptional regulator [Paracoccaceae bacterium]